MVGKILVFREMLVFGEELMILGTIITCEGWGGVPPMDHAHVNIDRRRAEAHREEDPKKACQRRNACAKCKCNAQVRCEE